LVLKENYVQFWQLENQNAFAQLGFGASGAVARLKVCANL